MSSPAMVPSWRMPRGFRCTERLGFGSSSPLCLVRHCNPPEFFLAVHYNRFSGPGVNLPRGSPSGAVVSFHLESDLLEPVSTWLQVAGFDLFEEVPIVRHRADLVGLRGDGVTAIEMKLRMWDEALRQAIAYQLAADWAWVAMPLSSVSKAYHQRWRFEAEGLPFRQGRRCRPSPRSRKRMALPRTHRPMGLHPREGPSMSRMMGFHLKTPARNAKKTRNLP